MADSVPTPASPVLRELVARGFLHQCTDLEALDRLAVAAPLVAYAGFDATADSLHVGNLMSIMLLRLLQRHGHRPIALVGGGTTKVGDPSGKEEMRRVLDDAELARNVAGIRGVLGRFLRFGDGAGGAVAVDNAEWLDRLPYIPFLREYGRHFSVNRMLTQDSVRLRLEREQPLSFLEFNYMVLQAYDFLELSRRHGCVLQVGGSDQWGNIVMGVELARRVDDRRLFGLTTPLVTTASGAKMGKTAAGAVWLSATHCAPWDYWQFWRNVEDADVARFLRLYTELPLEEIAALTVRGGVELNAAKVRLATEATRLAHGEEAARAAEETAQQTFGQGGVGAALPTLDVPRAELVAGIPLFDLLRRADLAGSGGEARRLVRGGGARINDEVVADEMHLVTLRDATVDGAVKVSAGRKRHVLVRPTPA